MKNSNIQWIGDIPDNWEVLKNKYNFDLSKEIIGGESASTQLLSLTKNGIKAITEEQQTGKVPTSYNTYQVVKKNDIVMCLFDLDVSAVFSGISDFDGMISPAYKCFKCKPHLNPKYVDYYFRAVFVDRKYKRYSKNVRYSLSAEEFMTLPILVPPIKTQTAIATFLDAKCSEIDGLIADINKQIETLNELKKSTITEAVTKGLNKNVKLKDSGIQWCSKVPSHWEIKPFKYILQERSEKNYPIVTNERLSLSIGLGVTLYSEKTTNLDRFKDDVSQYKIAHKGDLVMNSMNVIVGAVGTSNYYGCVSPAYYTFFDTEEDHVTAKFCEYVFLTPPMRKILYSLGKGIMAIDRGEGRVNTCRLKVSKYDLGKIKIALPPIEEQRSIAKYLDKLENDTNSIISEKQNQISTLEAYKKSLIYEYVTGKKQLDI